MDKIELLLADPQPFPALEFGAGANRIGQSSSGAERVRFLDKHVLPGAISAPMSPAAVAHVSSAGAPPTRTSRAVEPIVLRSDLPETQMKYRLES
jgi:hypothetical protein